MVKRSYWGTGGRHFRV